LQRVFNARQRWHEQGCHWLWPDLLGPACYVWLPSALRKQMPLMACQGSCSSTRSQVTPANQLCTAGVNGTRPWAALLVLANSSRRTRIKTFCRTVQSHRVSANTIRNVFSGQHCLIRQARQLLVRVCRRQSVKPGSVARCLHKALMNVVSMWRPC